MGDSPPRKKAKVEGDGHTDAMLLEELLEKIARVEREHTIRVHQLRGAP